MTRWFRALARTVRCAAFLAVWTLRCRRTRPRPGSAGYEEWRRTYFSGATRGLLDRLGVVVRTDGDFPEGGGILVANHLGYLDILVLGSLGPAVFVSRADVADWPVIGRLTRWCGTIYIDRGRRDQIPAVLDQMADALPAGARVVFFPEGTSGSGDALLPFRESLFEAAARSGAPVHVAALTYRTEPGDPPARDAVCWWGDAGFTRHFLGLASLRGVRAQVSFGDRAIDGSDRKDLARRCRAAIEARFEPVTGSGAEV